jgi:hypothetical protein
MLMKLIADLLRFPQLLLGLVLAARGVALSQRLHRKGPSKDDQQSTTCLLQVRINLIKLTQRHLKAKGPKTVVCQFLGNHNILTS